MKNIIKHCITGLLITLTTVSCSADSSNNQAKPGTTAEDILSDSSEPSLKLSDAFPGLSFTFPLAAVQAPNQDDTWYVVEKAGRILKVNASNPLHPIASDYLDIRDKVDDRGEGGLLGFTFDPHFTENHTAYLSYTIKLDTGPSVMQSIISRIKESDSHHILDLTTESSVLTLGQYATNHNGGNIGFGPDGFLYIGFGDGGSGGDPMQNGQNQNTLLGTLLRIDVSATSTYKIPVDNPFVGSEFREEIYAWGLRNPWRWSFDSSTGQLWLADVGQGSIEEVNIIEKGGNYGWNCYEGTHPYKPDFCQSKTAIINPVTEYSRDKGSSVTGGYVYRGSSIPTLQGTYLFGDFSSGRIWGLKQQADDNYRRQLLFNTNLAISSFAQSNNNQLLVIDYITGKVYQLNPKK